MNIGDTLELQYSPPIPERTQLWDDIYDRYYRYPGPPNRDSGANILSNNFVCIILLIYISKLLLTNF